jgi:hypothetical protein
VAWAPDYVTVSELKSYRRIDGTGDDIELALAAGSASRAIDGATGRQFGKTDAVEIRTYKAGWSDSEGCYFADIDDVQTLAGLVVTVSGAAVTSGDYELWPVNADKDGKPWEKLYVATVTPPTFGRGLGTVQVAATFGWTAVPVSIRNACLLQASKFFVSRNMPHGIAGSPDLGNEMRLLAKEHPEVELMLKEFTRHDKRADVG